VIRREGDALFVRDLGSTNGTLVNGRRITNERKLGESDVVRVGDAELVVVAVRASKPAPPGREVGDRQSRPNLWEDTTTRIEKGRRDPVSIAPRVVARR
jgi:pSer/pThr/pTyr-binding forkhead associated (FHA) protein